LTAFAFWSARQDSNPGTTGYEINCRGFSAFFPRLPLQFGDSRPFGKKPNGCPGSQLQAEVAVPSIGFIWKSDPLNMSKSHFAILGEEIHGRTAFLPYMIGRRLKQWRIVPCLCDSAVCIR